MLHLIDLKFYMSEANIKISNVCFLQFFVKLNASVIQGPEVREKNAENREKTPSEEMAITSERFILQT